MAEMNRTYEKKLQLVRAVLLAEWDPIGVRDEPAARDEYDRYIPALLGMLERKANADEIARYLDDVGSLEMGLVAVEAKSRVAAKILLQIE